MLHPRLSRSFLVLVSFLAAAALAPSAFGQAAPYQAATAAGSYGAPSQPAPSAPSYGYKTQPAPASYGRAAQPAPAASSYGYVMQPAPASYRYFVRAAEGPRAESAAPKPERPRDYHVDLGVGTEVPLYVGGLLTAELPHRLLLQVGVGVMPRAYIEAIDSALTQAGAYDAAVSTLVRNSLGNSMVVRASIGGRPFPDHGFEILGGYTLLTMGGAVAPSDVINAVLADTGASLQVPAGLAGDIPVSATLHNFHASLGWRWLLADDRLVIRASLSYFQTLDSHVSVKIPQTATAIVPYEGQINSQINALIGPYFAKYAKAPTLGLSAAVRF